jgi:hypothetical protein
LGKEKKRERRGVRMGGFIDFWFGEGGKRRGWVL